MECSSSEPGPSVSEATLLGAQLVFPVKLTARISLVSQMNVTVSFDLFLTAKRKNVMKQILACSQPLLCKVFYFLCIIRLSQKQKLICQNETVTKSQRQTRSTHTNTHAHFFTLFQAAFCFLISHVTHMLYRVLYPSPLSLQVFLSRRCERKSLSLSKEVSKTEWVSWKDKGALKTTLPTKTCFYWEPLQQRLLSWSPS